MEFSFIEGSSAPNQETAKLLFEMAMNKEWGGVVEKLEENPFFLVAEVTKTKDTLLNILPHFESLQLRNNQGNTALHLAAMVGNVAMCKSIASVDSSLIGEPNYKGESPLFTAVLFGQKQVFQCLYDLCRSNDERHGCSKNPHTGDTILHYAISEDHFDLALRIIELYGKALANAVNEDGITALHLLADKPSAFKSGSLLLHGFRKRIIYNCIFIDEHEVEQNVLDDPKEAGKALDQYFPENYKTCIDFFLIFGGFVRSFGRKGPETAILIAARNGIFEIVEKLLEQFPIAIHDLNEENKNAMLLAVQNRQPHVFQILLEKNILVRDSMLRAVDESKNNVAHLAAKLGEYRPWLTLGEALHMQYEIK